MPVNLVETPDDALLAVRGVRIGVACAGVRKPGRKDLTVMILDPGSSVGAVFTQNRFSAAPVQLCKAHLALDLGVRALLINTGNANAGTGESGLAHALLTCQGLAEALDISAEQVLPFSTGVIMEPLPVDRILAGLPGAIADAQAQHWGRAAQGIMTTDTVAKARSAQLTIGEQIVNITGISKGAGMIRPNMATMLGFMATDANVAPTLLPELARFLADRSFNRITVDGDTSTNDSFVVMATHKAGHAPIDSLDSREGKALCAAMLEVARWLAHAIVRDGEGATKFIAVTCSGANSSAEALSVCYAISHSPLVKTAFFASDPNLGRILAAVGYAGVSDMDQSTISLSLDDVPVVHGGGRLATYQEADGARVLEKSEIAVHVDLGRGNAVETVWTCDLSYDYVKINADYRS